MVVDKKIQKKSPVDSLWHNLFKNDANRLADVDYVSCHCEIGELKFEFLELSDRFEHGVAVRNMVTSQYPSNEPPHADV